MEAFKCAPCIYILTLVRTLERKLGIGKQRRCVCLQPEPGALIGVCLRASEGVVRRISFKALCFISFKDENCLIKL